MENQQQQQQQRMAALMQAQTQARVNVVRAQHQFEVKQAENAVRNLRSQIRDRVTRLEHLLGDVDRAVGGADEVETFRYANGAFGSDTDTLDTLLAAMGQAVEHLASLREKGRIVEAEHRTAVGTFEAEFAKMAEQHEPVVVAEPDFTGGQYL